MSPTILIVDDEPVNLAILRQILAPEYELGFAKSGEEALKIAIKLRPALILLDIQMPGMDGFAVCRALKADLRTECIPVIFVTSLAQIGDEAAGFAVGAVDYIVKPVSPSIVCARVRTHLSLVSARQLEQSYQDAIAMLGEASEFRDADTGAHIWRMAAYASSLAAECGWNAEACRRLKLAAPMHDIGKLGIADAILLKPAKLDAAEWAVMQTHSSIGHNILSKSTAPILQMAATIALHHHERWDGSGYPHGLAGDTIPEVARIVAIADVFDALTMARPYKEPWPLDRVLKTMNDSAGSHFDASMIGNFMEIMQDILAIGEHWASHEFDCKRRF